MIQQHDQLSSQLYTQQMILQDEDKDEEEDMLEEMQEEMQEEMPRDARSQQFLDFAPFKPLYLHPNHHLNRLIYNKLARPNFLNLAPPKQKKPQKAVKPQKACKPISLKLTIYLPSYNILAKHKKLTECQGDILIIPYQTTEMQMYPGNVLKSSLRANIQKLIEMKLTQGTLYLKKQPILQYSFIGFIRVSSQQPLQHLIIGMNSIFLKMRQKGMKFDSLGLAYDKRFNMQKLMRLLMSELQLQFFDGKKEIDVILEDVVDFQTCLSVVGSINAS